jgi:uncharacterized protein
VTKTTTLRLASDLALPLETVTQTIAVLAKRRAGKSYTMRRLVEQLLKAGQQVVLVDPKGDQWGIRYAADGKAPGLAMVILGGERGDVPLEAGGGEVVAKLVVEERVSALLDLSLFRKYEVATFMTAFLEHLYRLKAREIYRTPVMLVIDEADAIAPQKPQKGEERMLGAAEDIVRRGGQRGIGCVLVTQRSAVLNKNVLTQAQVLIVLRTIAPQDLLAMKAWVDVHGTDEEGAEMMGSLPSLPIGDAWFWSPGWPAVDGIFRRVHVLPIETFDSGKSPEPGVKPVDPSTAAAVDLEALTRQMAATIEKAKAEDPRELRKQLAERDQRLKKLEAVATATKNIPGTILTADERRLIQELGEEFRSIGDAIADRADDVLGSLAERAKAEIDAAAQCWTDTIAQRRALFLERLQQTRVQAVIDKLSQITPTTTTATMHPRSPLADRVAPALAQATSSRPARQVSNESVVKGGKFREMLIALAQARRPLSDTQIAARAVMAVSGTFDKYLSMQRAHGWVDGSRQALQITAAGLAALGPFDPLPTGEALQEHWLRELGTGKAAEMLRALIAAYPSALSDAQVAQRAEMALSGTFDKYLSTLRRLQLVDGPRAALRASEELIV